jgi:ComF family protein
MQFWKNSILPYFKALVHLFYPQICLHCGTDLLLNHQIICNNCEAALPYTHFATMQNNPIEKIFWGRCSITHATAVLYFTKDSLVQKIMVELKYKQNKKAGDLLGRLIAKQLVTANYSNIDYLVPIPISKKKIRKRGFNQSHLLCEFISKNGFSIPIFTGLIKSKETVSQTQKTRLTRAASSTMLFTLQQQDAIKGKHLLLIDDVITTGATLENAYTCLMQAQPASIRIATAAYTYY